MKVLIIGGNRFVGLRLSHLLDPLRGYELHILNRTGQVAHSRNAVVHKGDRTRLDLSQIDRDWDLIYDFACYTGLEAQAALKYFNNVGRYIFVSTVSVYDPGADLKEEAFNAKTWNPSITLANEIPSGQSYQYGKRAAEAVFSQQDRFPVLHVRFPFILGPDDYTHRLEFHVDRTRRGESIYVPNLNARFSVIQSQDAARFLYWAREKALAGPINVASQTPVKLRDILAQIELITGQKPQLATREEEGNHSPYGIKDDWFVDVSRMNEAGFIPRPAMEWLPGLIGAPEPPSGQGFVH